MEPALGPDANPTPEPPGLGQLDPTPAPPMVSEAGRGRLARTPAEIPPKGWRDVFWRVVHNVTEDRILALAGGIAYYALLAVFPGVAMIVSLYGLVADPSTVADHLILLAEILPPGTRELLSDQMIYVASKRTETLGTAFVASLLISLWSANAGVSALFDALNVVYKETEKRPLWRFYAQTLLFTVVAVAFLVVALTAIVGVPIALNRFGFGTYADELFALARWPVLFVAVVVGLSVVYRLGPSREPAKWRWITWGSVVAAAVWIAGSMLFSWYVANYDSYNRMYGSLGAVVAFQIWLWLSSVIVLVGAELNAEAEHQTARDSTEGPEKPLGARGAVMADHIGPAQE